MSSATATAKIFVSGNSQAVRLPRSFRIDAAEVWISRNEVTGEITLQPKPRPDELQDFLTLLAAAPRGTEDFVPPREDAPAANPLADWLASAN
jgi:antitoxin VapB